MIDASTVFLLDSLDQLAEEDFKSVDKWLLTSLPARCKLLVSVIPGYGNLLDMITRMMRQKCKQRNPALTDAEARDLVRNQVLNVKQLKSADSEKILTNWLQAANMQLTDAQWTDLRHIFTNGTLLPLFIKLIYDEVSKCHSYDTIDPAMLRCRTIDDMIAYRFNNLEKLHGRVLLSRALSYMTVCKHGVSKTELEDLLSLDEDVLFTVFEYSLPPVRRLPTMLWIRITSDLAEYIAEKEANDTKVIYWAHRRFIETTHDMYIRPAHESSDATIYTNILDYFNETWFATPKPFELNAYLKQKYSNVTSHAAMRYVSAQPIEYTLGNGRIRYNKRKLVQVPNCLAQMCNCTALIPSVLRKAAELVFFNYEFMVCVYKYIF